MANKIKVLYITHYFPPEVNAPAVRVSEMTQRWSDKDAEVTVLTGFPNHPIGIIPDKYKGMKRLIAKFGKINLIRTYLYAAPNKGFLRRILNYLSFMFSAIFLGAPKVGKPDILIATSPQFFVAVAGYVISRIKKCKFVFEIRDIWPEEIVAVGAIKNRLVIRLLEALEMFLYRKADLLVAVAEGTIEILTKRGITAEKIAFVPNGVNIDHFNEAPNGYELRKNMNIDGKFVVSYIGTHGMAHKLSTVIDAADQLKDNKDIHFLFVGDGAEKKSLKEYAEKLNLTNITFHDQISRDRIPEFYQATDLFLVPLKKAKLFTKNIPSKIYEIMASRKPILISTEGESKKMIEKSASGLSSTPEDSNEMAQKILYLFDNQLECEKMGNNGYNFVIANANRMKIADNYLDILNDCVHEKQSISLKERKIPVEKEQIQIPA